IALRRNGDAPHGPALTPLPLANCDQRSGETKEPEHKEGDPTSERGEKQHFKRHYQRAKGKRCYRDTLWKIRYRPPQRKKANQKVNERPGKQKHAECTCH